MGSLIALQRLSQVLWRGICGAIGRLHGGFSVTANKHDNVFFSNTMMGFYIQEEEVSQLRVFASTRGAGKRQAFRIGSIQSMSDVIVAAKAIEDPAITKPMYIPIQDQIPVFSPFSDSNTHPVQHMRCWPWPHFRLAECWHLLLSTYWKTNVVDASTAPPNRVDVADGSTFMSLPQLELD